MSAARHSRFSGGLVFVLIEKRRPVIRGVEVPNALMRKII